MSFFGLIWILLFFLIILNVLGAIIKKFSGASSSSRSGKWMNTPMDIFRSTARNEAWMHTAGELNLSYIRPKRPGDFPEISGRTDRMDVSIFCAPSENGFPPETVCRIKLPSSLKIGLLIMKDHPEEIRRNFSGRRQYSSLVEISPADGMESAVSAYDEKSLKEYLTPERAQFISDCLKRFPMFRIDDDTLVVRFPGIERDTDRFVSRLNQILHLAGKLAEKKTAGKTQSLATAQPLNPMPLIDDMELKQKLMKEKEAEKNISIPATVPEPEEEEEPTSPPEPIIPESEIEPEVEPAPIPVVPEQENAPEPKTVPDALPSKEQLLSTLWKSSSVGPKEKELFEKYKGRSVQWDGVLKTSYDFATDFVFGSGGGVKATLELLELTPANSLLRTKIKAVVHFPKEDAAVLKSASGKTVVFQGDLLKIEPFAREIYLSNGKVIQVES